MMHCEHCRNVILQLRTRKEDLELFHTSYLKETQVEIMIASETKSETIIVDRQKLIDELEALK